MRKEISEEYKNSLKRQYREFIDYSQISKNSLCKPPLNLSRKFSALYNNIYEIVRDRYNLLFRLNSEENIDCFCGMLLNNYYNFCVDNDQLVESILYIDVSILMYDYKKLIDRDSEGVGPSLTYSKDVLYEKIESATMVIWDKLNTISSNFERQKLLDILSIRKRKELGNIYFIKNYIDNKNDIITEDIRDAMNIIAVVDCEQEFLKY